ncbi:DNA repair protein RadC [Candidatus Falkowbacteria bacterium]|nr:MAG: DNA repair protein RadC [Candidatus Falkowbacteria bacterium]
MRTSYTLTNQDLILDEKTTTSFKEYILRIQDMPSEDRPREKLLQYGPSALTVAELVAVVLATGTKKEDVMSMASRMIRDYGEKTLSSQTDAKALSQELQIPEIKALQIVACAELGRRFFDRREYGRVIIRTAKDVYEYLKDLRTLSKEHLRGLYVNTHHRLIHDEVISIGTINSNLIHPREVFKPAIEYGAVAVILAHNHPSGIVTASAADIEITKRIIESGKIIGIPLVDHVIIGKNKFASIDAGY